MGSTLEQVQVVNSLNSETKEGEEVGRKTPGEAVAMDMDIVVAVVEEEVDFLKEEHNVVVMKKMMMIHNHQVETQNLDESDYNSENCKTHLHHYNPNSENTDSL